MRTQHFPRVIRVPSEAKARCLAIDGIYAPDEVHLLGDGRAIAVHEDSGDFTFNSLKALETAYRIRVVA